MAYGGGIWNYPVQNKKLPGTYIVFKSKARPTNQFAERGYVAFAMELPWGNSENLITVEAADLQKKSMELFGLQYNAPELMPLREALLEAKTAYIYRLNGDGTAATASEGEMTITAKYAGTGGNNITISVVNNIDDETLETFDIEIRKDNVLVYKDTVSDISQLENEYVTFSGVLVPTAGLTLTGGSNGSVTADAHTKFLAKIEKKYINVLAYAGTDEGVTGLYYSFTTRRNNKDGAYFQLITHANNYNSELVLSNELNNDPNMVYYLAGIMAGTNLDETAAATIYQGELKPYADYTQSQLIDILNRGQLAFHEVDGQIRLFADINTFTDYSIDKNEDFSKNQNIRLFHQIGNDWPVIFNTRYLDKALNNEMNRTALWNDLYNHLTKLEGLGAIQNLESEDLIVEQGEAKDAVYSEVHIQSVLMMNKLYVVVINE